MLSRNLRARRHEVCKKGELEIGGLRSVTVGGRRLAVTCLAEGSYRAVSSTCPHEMANLAAGRVERMWVSENVGELRPSSERSVIVCPWHNFEFDLDTGLSPCEPGRLKIKTYRTGVKGDDVVVYV